MKLWQRMPQKCCRTWKMHSLGWCLSATLNLKAIPTELTCTQLPQKWNVPSGSSKTLDKAVKFDHLLFEKADFIKTSKRCLVKGIREEYCATPPFALTVTEEEIKRMSNAFREVTRASLFCKALESSSYKPCELFNTSCSRQKRQRLPEECTGNLEQTPEYILVEEILKMYPVAIVLLQIWMMSSLTMP